MEHALTNPAPPDDHAMRLEAVGRLAAGIAHEINTPVQFIGDNLHFLSDAITELQRVVAAQQAVLSAWRHRPECAADLAALDGALDGIDLGYLAGETPKAIAQSLEGVQRVAAIVKAMKDFSHPDTGAPVPGDLNRAVQSTLTLARNEYKYVADLALDLDPHLPQVTCQIGAIQQVVLNLVVNAAHAIGDALKSSAGSNGRGRITVSTALDGRHAVIAITDTGTGIPAAIQGRIFEPFFTTKPVGRGTGQGLHISREIVVERHGGSLAFTTSEGHGTTFTIRLPLEPGHV